MLARDVMQTDVRTVRPQTTVQEVAELLSDASYSGLPVVDENRRLVGIITTADLLARAQRLDVPTFFPFIGGIVYLQSPRKFEEQLRKATGEAVADVMTTDLVTVAEETPVQEIATLMVERKINRVPVVKEGRLVGIVARDDIVRAVHLGARGGAKG